MFTSKFQPNAKLLVTWNKVNGEQRTLMARVPSDYNSTEAQRTGYGLVLCLETGSYKKIKLDSIVSVHNIKEKARNGGLERSTINSNVSGVPTPPETPRTLPEGFKTPVNGIAGMKPYSSYSKRRNPAGTLTVKCGTRIIGYALNNIEALALIEKDRQESV